MFHPNSLRRGAIALVLFSSLALAQAAPSVAEPSGPYRQEIVRPHHGGLLARFWQLMASLWGTEGTANDPTGHH
jgi:hypothetical protein